jgi:outer membrane receptor protein involved in Fe transport
LLVKRLFSFLLSLLFLCATAVAQSATVSGVITDKSGKPVRGAAVTLRSRGVDRKTTQTDDEGRYQFENVEVGDWEIRATAPQLMPVEYELNVKGDEPVNVEIVMPDRQMVEQRVEVVATKLAEDPADVPGAIQVFGGDELSARAARDLPTALAQATGVAVVPGGDGGPAGSVPEFWGLKEFDAFLLAVDGVPWGGAFNPALTSLTMSDVERIEVMRGPAPVS